MNTLLRTTALTTVALAFSSHLCAAQDFQRVPPAPMKRAHYEELQKTNPALLNFLTHAHSVALVPKARRPDTSPWQPVTTSSPVAVGNPLLLTDGTVMVEDTNGSVSGSTGSSWFKLTPDINGSYVNGTWSQIASLQAGYLPLYVASAGSAGRQGDRRRWRV